MSLSNTFETALLNLIFGNVNAANIGDATGLRGSSSAGTFYISLHTADPGEAGSQSSSEATYTDYARVAVARGSGFSVSGNTVSNTASIGFPSVGAGSGTITHFGIGTDASGAGTLLMSGPLNTSLAFSVGSTPTFAAGAMVVTAD